MLEYISRLSNADQERMQSVLSQLYRQTFCWKENMTKGRGGSSSITIMISVSSTWNS